MITHLLDNAKHKCLSRSVQSFSQALRHLTLDHKRYYSYEFENFSPTAFAKKNPCSKEKKTLKIRLS